MIVIHENCRWTDSKSFLSFNGFEIQGICRSLNFSKPNQFYSVIGHQHRPEFSGESKTIHLFCVENPVKMINFLAMKCMKDYLSASCSLMIIFLGFPPRVALKIVHSIAILNGEQNNARVPLTR